MTTITGAQRQQQRIEHLALGHPRPPLPEPKRPKGMSRLEWKQHRPDHVAAALKEQQLAPDIELRVALREKWARGRGTPETHEHSEQAKRRAGCLARLFGSGTINADQVIAATEISETYEAIGAIVGVKSSLAALNRVDCGFRPDLAGEQIGHSAWMERTYDRWRQSVDGPIAPVLAMVVHDAGLVEVARHYRLSDRRAREILVAALDLWIALRRGRARVRQH